MLELRMAKPQEREEICHLWRAVYADEDALMDSFFQACGLEEVMLLKEDGVLRTYIAAPRARLHLPDGQVVDTAYLYALGTDPDHVMRAVEEEVDRDLLRQAVMALAPRDREIVTMRFGLSGDDGLTQKEVADKLGISQSYISRLEKRIMSKLKKDMIKRM